MVLYGSTFLSLFMLAQLGWTQSPEKSIQMAADLNKTLLNLQSTCKES